MRAKRQGGLGRGEAGRELIVSSFFSSPSIPLSTFLLAHPYLRSCSSHPLPFLPSLSTHYRSHPPPSPPSPPPLFLSWLLFALPRNLFSKPPNLTLSTSVDSSPPTRPSCSSRERSTEERREDSTRSSQARWEVTSRLGRGRR